MDVSLSRRVFTLRSSGFYLLIGTFVLTALLIATFTLGLKLWQIGTFVFLAWCPLVFYVMMKLYRFYGAGISMLFLLVISQTAHLIEHTSQMIQIHLLGLKGAQASGIIGQLNTEWVHLIWNSWVLAFCFLLFYWLRKNPWLYALFVFGVYHEAEHLYIISVYLRTGISGTPGFLAKGGLFFGGIPLIRPDVHFLYAVLEEALLIGAFIYEVRKAQAKQLAAAPRLAAAS